MSFESLRARESITGYIKQITTPKSKQLPAASSTGVALLTPPQTPHAQRSETPTRVPPGPSRRENKTIPTPDASPPSVLLRGRPTRPRHPGQNSSIDPPQEVEDYSPPSDHGTLARSRAPVAAPRAQARPVCPRPSNPRIRSTLELIEQVRDTKYKRRVGEFCSKRKLLPNEYKKLLSLIEESEDVELRKYFNDKLRFNYIATKKTFSVRMLSECHEAMKESLHDFVQHWLGLVKTGSIEINGTKCSPATSEAAKSIKTRGSAPVNFGSRRGVYMPDQSYKFGYRKFPSLIVEVAWSETDEDLRQKSRNYIAWSKGAVRTVVAVSLHGIFKHVDDVGKTRRVLEEDFDYGVAKAFVYRSNTAPDSAGEVVVGEDQIFRDTAGNMDPGAELRLSLQDFIPDHEVRKVAGLDNPEFIIDAEQLIQCTTDALTAQWVMLSDDGEGAEASTGPEDRARRRVRRLSRELKSLGAAVIPSKLRSGRR